MDADTILEVAGLQTRFQTEAGVVRSVDGVDFSVRRGETLAVVGESGSGKSVTCLSVMRLVDAPGVIAGGSALFRRQNGEVVDLLSASDAIMGKVRGADIAMIFQEPMTSLNPLYTVGDQIAEVIRQHRGAGRREAWQAAVSLLDEVRIADPARRAEQYPFEMSGGMLQRVMIAIALACRPGLLLADEPTTALDVTVQAQILDLMRGLRDSSAKGMGIVFVTHNMGVVAEIADRILVMYAGLVVETGTVAEVFARPRHPYTRGLLASMVRAGRDRGRRAPLPAIPGTVPDPLERPRGCPFAPRCELAQDACRSERPPLFAIGGRRETRCRRWEEL